MTAQLSCTAAAKKLLRLQGHKCHICEGKISVQSAPASLANFPYLAPALPYLPHLALEYPEFILSRNCLQNSKKPLNVLLNSLVKIFGWLVGFFWLQKIQRRNIFLLTYKTTFKAKNGSWKSKS